MNILFFLNFYFGIKMTSTVSFQPPQVPTRPSLGQQDRTQFPSPTYSLVRPSDDDDAVSVQYLEPTSSAAAASAHGAAAQSAKVIQFVLTKSPITHPDQLTSYRLKPAAFTQEQNTSLALSTLLDKTKTWIATLVGADLSSSQVFGVFPSSTIQQVSMLAKQGGQYEVAEFLRSDQEATPVAGVNFNPEQNSRIRVFRTKQKAGINLVTKNKVVAVYQGCELLRLQSEKEASRTLTLRFQPHGDKEPRSLYLSPLCILPPESDYMVFGFPTDRDEGASA